MKNQSLFTLFTLVLLAIFISVGSVSFAEQGNAHYVTTSGITTRISVDSNGEQSIGGGADVGYLSADGRYIVFQSFATNLVNGDTNGKVDIFVRDRETESTTRVSINSNGDQADGNSSLPRLSSDGRYIVFASDATNLVNGDTNGMRDIFVHDRQNDITTRVSVNSNGVQANISSDRPSISANGRYVVFNSGASNLVAGDTNGYHDVFMHDIQTGTTTRVSVNSSGEQANHQSTLPFTANGNYITFASQATNLVSEDTNGKTDIFVHNIQTGNTSRVSINSNGEQANNLSSLSSISADNRYVVFNSLASNLVIGDTNATHDIFIHDIQDGSTVRVSVNSDGEQANNSSDYPWMSSDGRYIAFRSSASNLTSDDTGSIVDVFVHDTQIGTTQRVSINSNEEQANDYSGIPSLSDDGRYVAFYSVATNLVDNDTNGVADVFLRDRGDLILPSSISDLIASTGSVAGQVDLSWTAPGNDGDSGTATTYTVRYADSAITTELSWQSASDAIGEPTPQPAGTPENMTVSGLTPGQTYYFAIRAEDEAGNMSELSNSPSAMAKEGADLGFRPNPNGYQFANKQLNRSWEMFEQYFGSENVLKPDGTRCIAANSFFQNNYLNVAERWSCVGFSATSFLSYLDWEQPYAGSFTIPHFAQLYQQPESAELTNPIAYYSGIQTAKQWSDAYYLSKKNCNTNPNAMTEMIESIRLGLENQQPLIVSLDTVIYDFHAVAPYRIEDISPTIVDVYVYDSEAPSQERIIRFQNSGGNWQWTYTFVGSVGGAETKTGGCDKMYMYDLQSALEQGLPRVNFCQSPGTTINSLQTAAFSGKMLAHLPADGDWVIQDNLGQRLGWINGTFVSEIPDAYHIPQASGNGSLSFRVLELPKAEYNVTINNAITETIEYSLFGDGRLIEVSGNLQSIGSSATLSVTSNLDRATLSGLQNLDSFVMGFDNELATESQLATITGIPASGNENLNASFNNGQIVISRTNGIMQYSLAFEKNDGQLFVSELLTLGANNTHTLRPTDWATLNTTDVILEIDYDSDGTVDDVQELTNQLNREFVYLPVVIRP